MQLTKHWAAQLDDYVIDLAWSPDGMRLAAASAAGPIKIFSAPDGATQHELPGHENGTNALAWMPMLQKPEARSQTPEISPSALSPDLWPLTSAVLATGGQDGAVKFWDAANGQHTATAALGNAWIEHLAWRPLGTPVLAAAAGRQFSLLNPDASVRHSFPPAPKTISALAWPPRGGCVAVAYFGGVCLWDADDFVAQKELAYANGIHALVWSPDGKWLVSGNQDPSVHLWLPEADAEFHMSGYESKVKHLTFDHTSRWIATSGGRDSCVWDCSGAGPEGRAATMLPHDAPVCAVAFQQKHGLLATASQDSALLLWSPERKQPLRATVRMAAAAAKLAWSPDDQHLAVGTEAGAIYVLKCEN